MTRVATTIPLTRALVVVCFPLSLSAQSIFVGKVDSVLPAKLEQPCLSRTPKGSLGFRRHRGNLDLFFRVGDTSAVLLDDSYFVEPATDVRVHLTTDGYGKG